MNKKKLLALLMALVMTFSLVPVTAFAEGEAVTDPVARVVRGTTVISSHNTLNEAVASANEAATESDWTVVSNGTAVADQLRIDVYKDISLNQNLESKVRLEVPKGYNVTFDLCGYQFVSTYGAYSIANYGNLTITDSSNSEEYGTGTGAIYNTNKQTGRFYSRDAVRNYGTITINGGNFGDADTDRDNANNNQWGFALRNHGIATINGGYFTACDNFQDSGNVYSYAISNQSNAEMTINYATVYGKMNGGVSADGGAITINDGNYCVYAGNDTYYVLARSYGNFVINGGSFQKFGSGGSGRRLLGGFDGLPSWDESETKNGFTVTGGSFVINAGTDSANTLNITPTTYVAQIGSAKYETLEEAFADANDVDTITLLRDVVLSDSIDVDKGLVLLDLAGHTISADESKVSDNKFTGNASHDYLIGIKYGGNLWVYDSEGEGEIDASNLLVAIKLTTKGETVNDEDVSADLTVGLDDADNNFTITGGVYGISGNGTRHQTSLEVNGGTIVGENGTGIFQPQDGYMFIEGGTIVGADAAVEIRSGYDITLWGGTFQVTGNNPYHVEANGSGTTTKGAAIAIAQHTTEKGISVTIMDGNNESGDSFEFLLPEGAVALSVADPENKGFDNVEFILTEDPNDLFGGNYELEDGYHWYEVSGDESGVYSLMESAAEILGANNDHVAYHQSFSAAVSNAQPGQTVKLLADVALAATVNIDKNLTIDLNGNDIASTDARALWVKSGDVTITGSGTISATATEDGGFVSSSSVIRVGDSADNAAAASLTVGENVTVSSNHCYGITAFGKNAGITLTVNGTVNVSGKQAAISGNGSEGLSATTMTINGSVSATQDYAIYHPGKGTLTVTGTVTGKGGIEAKGGIVNITGGTVSATGGEATSHKENNNGTSTANYALAAVENGNYQGEAKFTISGGTIEGTVDVVKDNEASWHPSISITGGTFNRDPNAYVAQGYEAVNNGNGTWTVSSRKVAQIGNDKYETLQSAFAAANAAQSETTITLLDSVNLTEQIEVNGDVVLDLNGKNIATTHRLRLVTGSFEITGHGSITTTNPGMAPVDVRFDTASDKTAKRTLTIGTDVTLNGPCYGLNIFGTNNDAVANDIDVTIDGTVNGMLFVLGNLKNTNNSIDIVVNGTVDASKATGEEAVHTGIALNGYANVTVNNGATVKGESGIEVRAGRLTVNGGAITATANSYNYDANGNGTTTKGAAIAVAQHNTKLAVNATLNGGTLEGVKQISVTDVNSDMSAVTVVASENYTQNSVIPEGYKWVNGTAEGTKTLAEVTPVAQVGEEEYTTLKAAVEAITGTTGTITLLDDIDLAVDPLTKDGYAAIAPVGKEITLDLGAYTISNGALDVYGTLNVTGTTGSITGGLKHGIWVNEGGVLNVQGGTITTTGEGYPVIANPGTVNISGGTVTNTTGAGAVYVNNGSLTISGGTVTSTKDGTEAVRVVGNTEATISGGTVTGHDYGVTVFDTAKLTVRGNATIGTAENEGYAICTNGNGGQNATVIIEDGNITGKELGIYQPSGKLTVTGGTITGATGIYFKSNSLNITGGTITGNGDEVAYNYYGNGAHPTGDALVIDSCNYPNGINDVSVSGGNFNSTKAKAVGSYNSEGGKLQTNFITGGKYSSEPDSSYVADGHKAAKISEGDYKFQVGVVEVTTTSSTNNNDSVTFQVTTTVEEHKGSTNPPLESNTNLSVTVSGTSNEEVNQGNAATAAAALTNIKDDALEKIVSSAIEAAGASITSSTENANVVIQLAKSGATVESGKVTYEVHPEAIIRVGNETVGTVALNNSQIKDSFSFSLYAGNIPGWVDGKKILVTHTHDDGTTEEHGPYTVDDAGYIKLEGITSFSDFTLEAIEEATTVWAKYSYSLTLEDSIKINFKVKDLQDNPGNYTVAYGFGETKDDSWTVATLEYADLNSFEIGSFAAKEMGKEVHVIVYHGNQKIKDTYYSVKRYCDTVINGNYGAEITALCKATLDYGRYAQEAFNYETGALVNGGNDYFTNSNIEVPYATSTKTPNGSYVTGVSLSLITTAETQLVARFKTDVMPTSVTIDDHPIDSWVYADGVVKVTATGISAKDLNKNVTFVVTDGSGSYTYTVSPTYYMYLAISKNSQVSLNRAFYNYYLKAAAYFATK